MASLNPQTLINDRLSYYSLNGQGTDGTLLNPSVMKSLTASETLAVESDFSMLFKNGTDANTITQSTTGITLAKGNTSLTVGDDVKANGTFKVENTAGTDGLSITPGTNTVISAKDGTPSITLNGNNSVGISNDLTVGGNVIVGPSGDATTLTKDYLSFGGTGSVQIGGIQQSGTNVYVGSGTGLVTSGMKFDAQENATYPGDITSSRSKANHGGNLIVTADNITATLSAKGSTIVPTGSGFFLGSINNVTPTTETLNTVQMSGINGVASSQITTVNGRLDIASNNKSIQIATQNANINCQTTGVGGDINLVSVDAMDLRCVNTMNLVSSGGYVNVSGNQFNVAASTGMNISTTTGNIRLAAPNTNVVGNLAVTGTITGGISPSNPLNISNSGNIMTLNCGTPAADDSSIQVNEGSVKQPLTVWLGNNAFISGRTSTATIGAPSSINFSTGALYQNSIPMLGGIVNSITYSGSATLQGGQYWLFNCRNPSASNGYLTPMPTSTDPIPAGLYFVSSTSFSYQNETRSVGSILSFSGGPAGTCAGFFFGASPRSNTNDWSYLQGNTVGALAGSFTFNFQTGGGAVAFAITITRIC